MPDDPNINQPPASPAAPPPATPPGDASASKSEEMVPKSRVEEIVRERLERDRKARQDGQAAPPKHEPKTTAGEDFSDIREEHTFRNALDDVMDELDWKPSKDDRALLRSMHRAGGKDQMASLAGRLKAAQPSGGAPAPAAPPATAAAPAYKPPPGAPSSPPDVIEGDPSKWDAAYVERLRRDGTFRSEVEKHYRSGNGSPFRRTNPGK